MEATLERVSGAQQAPMAAAPIATHETASTAVAAQAQAAINARYIMAMQRPRSWDQVRVKLLRECERPSFAQAARYRKPIGEGIEGLSIRFVEQALAIMGNVYVDAVSVYDDAQKRIVRVSVMDLETNTTYPMDVTVTKTVERLKLADGQTAISQRQNSYGKITYTVEATDDDILNKQGALVSKAVRTCGLRIIPGWLRDEAEEQILRTIREGVEKDPDAEKNKLVDAFAGIGVMPSQLEEYIGGALGGVTPKDLIDLRAAYTTIKDGETRWSEVLEAKIGRGGRDEKAPSAAEKKLEEAREKVRARAAQRAPMPRREVKVSIEQAPSPPSDDGWMDASNDEPGAAG